MTTRFDRRAAVSVGARMAPLLLSPYVLAVMFVLLVWNGERRYPWQAMNQCHWPRVPGANLDDPAVTVALVADPQLVDDHTYPGRHWALQAVTTYVTDVFLRRNWVYINQALDPDTTFFLGDLFDGGREWADEQWRAEFERFNSIFTRPVNKRTVMSLPGNHDIGFGDTVVPSALGRFQAYFGPPSSTLDVGNFTFVLLDTISLANSVDEAVYGPPSVFLQDLDTQYHRYETQESHNQRILLTHVPLYRSAESRCGKHRESSRNLQNVKGYQYQNMIQQPLTYEILMALEPVVVFSGDDHDACHVVHPYESKTHVQMTVDEFTVKSISMAMGVAKPGIQLLTLQGTKYATSICLMPSPFYAFQLYIVYGLFSLTVVALRHLFPSVLFSWLRAPRGSAQFPLPLYKEKMRQQSIALQRDYKAAALELVMIAAPASVFYLYLGHSIFA